MNTPAVVIDTVPFVAVARVARYVIVSPLASVAFTVPTTAPVEAFGLARVILEITGGLLVTAAAVTATAAGAGESS